MFGNVWVEPDLRKFAKSAAANCALAQLLHLLADEVAIGLIWLERQRVCDRRLDALQGPGRNGRLVDQLASLGAQISNARGDVLANSRRGVGEVLP